MKMMIPIFLLLVMFQSIHTIQTSEFTITEATIQDIQTAFKQNKITSKDLVKLYIQEIRKLNPIFRAVIEVNPDAVHQAEVADQERKANAPKSRFGLHGIPILLKDNIATKDKLNTTAGSYALLKSVVPRDAGVVKKLRESGAIILGKASLSEWANFRSSSAPNGWNARAKQAVNPYVATFDPCGSSTGSAISVATNMATVSLGTETDGSILCPSGANSIVGIKPTLGLTSRAGVIPISPRQDSVGRSGATLVENLGVDNFSQISSMLIDETLVLIAEFKIALNAYLKELVASPVRSLADVIAFNKKFADLEKIKEYPQDFFLAAESTNGIGKLEKEALMNLTRASKHGFEKLMKKNKLDALVTPYANGSMILAVGGYPGISVPGGYDKNGAPYGICFGGLKGSEPTLIEIAYGFEQATKFRKPPPIK
ncbi:probable amidase At4g34880 isoform X2 [Cynara cardunculus var. scolymus]|uniref:probable amidase At4g34880 isoform X2 n=1 Tax=Cynara cardunculus var. scolymus TaxID=59895 RepID=UPI000D626071|nr:probable amidase At4g34880 isoform X2 [Cynara cardunculus var. scolymus]